MMTKFEPKIQAFLCKWCASAGADLAGVSRLKYPSNILPIQINCSGRLDPLFVLRALEAGADGVFIGACHEGDCHYVDGNIKAKRRVKFWKKILEPLGLADRVTMQYVSASEGQKFQRVTKEFTEKIRKLGPSPVGKKRELTPIEFDEKLRKKKVIQGIVKNLADAVEYKPTEPFYFPEDQVMEGYGYPRRDTEKCIGCYACYNNCPEDVITIEEIDNRRVYGNLIYGCVDCKDCEEICPEEAIEVLPGFELMAYLLEVPLNDIEHDMQQCKSCGGYFAPIKHIEHAKGKINEAGVREKLKIPDDQWELCPVCKRKRVVEEAHSSSLKAAANFFTES